ncbi:hypothetical protein BDF19DRAFT_455932 [Syncephalis fuscata]|nr:hypothetical protein BDF19DRAFT_455932 [Syncephalis fuscata]
MTHKGKEAKPRAQQQQSSNYQEKRPVDVSNKQGNEHDSNDQASTSRKPHWRKRFNANRARRQEIGETVTIPPTWLSLSEGPNAVVGYENATELRPKKTNDDAELLADNKQAKPIIQVKDTDCLAEGLRLRDLGYNPLVLNMSSQTRPGGGFRSGAGAQEENLFRRTNLFKFLECRRRHLYPIPNRGGHYIRKAVVFRDTDANNYAFLPEPRTMAFVSVPALKRPSLEKNEAGRFVLNAQDRELTRDKIRAILNIGLKHGHDAIVLSALGCGAYGNPPADVAAAFYDVITREYCLPDEDIPASNATCEAATDPRRHGNLLPFQKQFKQFNTEQ